MAVDVTVVFVLGQVITYPKIDRLIEGDMVLRLEVKKFPALLYDQTMKHIASIPYSAIQSWTEKED